MKKITISIFLCCLLFSCGTDRTFNGRQCKTYGFINKEETKCPGVKYKVIKGNVIWGIILIETIFMPVYFFGFSLYEPVSVE